MSKFQPVHPDINPHALARSLQTALQELGVQVKLGTAQEAVAKLTGNTNWRTIAALRKAGKIAPSNEPARQAAKPRALVYLTHDRSLLHASDEGVDLYVLAEVEEEDGSDALDVSPQCVPARFQDLAEEVGAPVDQGVLALDEAPELVRKAFEHIANRYPGVSSVQYNRQGNWFYAYEDGSGPTFSNGDVDVGLLEDAADAVTSTSVTYQQSSRHDLASHEASSQKAQKQDLRERFKEMYAYQERVQDHPVMQKVLARIERAVCALQGVKGVRFRTNLTDRKNPANAGFFAHDGQFIEEFLPPMLRSVEPDDFCDEECLPYYRVRFADGQVLLVDDSELQGDDPRLGALFDTVSGVFGAARNAGFAGPWDLVAHGRHEQVQIFVESCKLDAAAGTVDALSQPSGPREDRLQDYVEYFQHGDFDHVRDRGGVDVYSYTIREEDCEEFAEFKLVQEVRLHGDLTEPGAIEFKMADGSVRWFELKD